jgi:hypothetical protein
MSNQIRPVKTSEAELTTATIVRRYTGGSIKNCRIGMEMSLTETVIGGGFSNGGIHNDKEHGDA